MTDLYTLALPIVMQFDVLAWLMAGTVIGILVGALPGLSVTMGVAILAPLTFKMEVVPALALLFGAYAGAIYGGSITAILLRIPGEGSAVMTTLDGYPMTQRGEGGRALTIATIASFLGGVISAVALALLAPPLAEFALRFSAPDLLAVAIFALAVIAFISQGTLVKGLLSGVLGLLIATVGLDPSLGYPRFTFDSTNLMNGLELVPIMIGLFGMSEVLEQLARPLAAGERSDKPIRYTFMSAAEFFRLLPAMLKATLVGLFIGVLPAAGATTASVVAYGVAKRTSKNPEEYGKGSVEALASVEAGNNASTGGDMVPTLALGVPGSSSTAVLMGALVLHGLQPGPLLFVEHPDIVSAIFILLLLANVAFTILGLLGAPFFAKAVSMPTKYLLPMVAMLCVVGAYSMQNSIFDVGVMLAAGIFGALARWLRFPVVPIILGMILGPMVESNLQRTFIVTYGHPTDIFFYPIAVGFLVATVLFLFWPRIAQALRRRSPTS